jgi:hypothetical protein
MRIVLNRSLFKSVPIPAEYGSSETGVMTRSLRRTRATGLTLAAVLWLLALGLAAPFAAEAGCSHLVTSRAENARRATLIEPFFAELSGHSERLPVPPPPRPCAGRWCSGDPAAPTVPSGVSDRGTDFWALAPLDPGRATAATSFTHSEVNTRRAIDSRDSIFHPPRHRRSA